MRRLLTLIYEKTWKTFLNWGIKNSRFLAFFEIGFKSQKTNLDFPKILIILLQNILFAKFLECICCTLAIYQFQSKHSRLVLPKKTCFFFFFFSTLLPLFVDGVQLSQCYKATTRTQFTFYQQLSRSTWYSFHQPYKDERVSRPWSHPVVLNPRRLNWEFSALTTRPLLQFCIQRF